MKKKFISKIMAVVLAGALAVGTLAGCGGQSADTSKKTIMWLSNLKSGAQYEAAVSYMTALCDELGYKLTIVYGDDYNDAAGNLQSVKNGMTSDVVGIVASQDGGLASIMEEYPDLYVAGYNTEMNSVFGEGGADAACLKNDHFLGTIADQLAEGDLIGKNYFDVCVEKGYRKVAVVTFPGFAYPSLEIAANTFVELANKYNAEHPEDQFTLAGDPTVLNFTPLEDSWFLEDGHKDLDAIVSMCAGTMFVFPTLVTAISNGTCSANTKMVTSGYDSDSSITSQIGDSKDKIISWLSISPCEDPAYAIILIDNAVSGKQYSDLKVQCLDSAQWTIDTDATMEKVLSKSILGTGKADDAQLKAKDAAALATKNNSSATYADLVQALLSISTSNL